CAGCGGTASRQATPMAAAARSRPPSRHAWPRAVACKTPCSRPSCSSPRQSGTPWRSVVATARSIPCGGSQADHPTDRAESGLLAVTKAPRPDLLASGSGAGVDPLDLDFCLVTDAQPGGVEQPSADAQGQCAPTARHGVRAELRAIQSAPDAHLLKAAQDGCHFTGNIDHCESSGTFRPEEPDGPPEPCTIGHLHHLLAARPARQSTCSGGRTRPGADDRLTTQIVAPKEAGREVRVQAGRCHECRGAASLARRLRA